MPIDAIETITDTIQPTTEIAIAVMLICPRYVRR